MTDAQWLGQAGFLLTWRDGDDSRSLLIDGYLSDSLAMKYRGELFPHERMLEAPLQVWELPRLEAALSTHKHTDHMDPGTLQPLFASQADAVFIAPRAEQAEAAARSGLQPDRMRLVDEGEEVSLPVGVMVHAVPAAHEQLDLDDEGRHRYLGYVIRFPDVTIYHSGDCVPYSGQAELLAGLGVDVALLPVNGRDDYRRNNGVPGNFSYPEAVALCGAAGIPELVPHHWGMFSFNTVDPSTFDAEIARSAGVAVRVIRHGEVLALKGDRR